MKEQMPIVILSGAKNLEANAGLTTHRFHRTLSVRRDIFMAEPVEGDDPIGVDEANRILEEAARRGAARGAEQRRQRAEQNPQPAEGAAGGRVPPNPPENPPTSQANPPPEDDDIFPEYIKDQINTIDNLKRDNKISPDEAWKSKEPLLRKLGEAMQLRARKDPAQLEALKAIEAIKASKNIDDKDKGKAAIKALRTISTSEGLSTELIDAMIDYDDALEYLVNRIISEPLDAETSGYQLSFYGGINFALIRDRIRVAAETHRTEVFEKDERHGDSKTLTNKALNKEGLGQKFEYMRSAAELFHNMNWKVVTGDIEQFVSAARGITVEHLQVLQRSKLAASVMRLYEQELQYVISRDGKITPENYAEVTGTILDKKGNPGAKIPGTVEKLLSLQNDSLPEDQKLNPWELKWAYYTGRNMMNITLRAAEVIAQSKEIGYRSYVQESASRIIVPLSLTAERFGIAEQRGGLHFLNMVKDNFHRDKKRFGWQDNGIKTMMGGDRIEFESRGIFNISGVWSGWRENNIIQIWDPDRDPKTNSYFESVDLDNRKINRRRTISIEQLSGKINDLAAKDKDGNPIKKDRKGRDIGKAIGKPEALRKIFLGENGELKDSFCHSLGILLKFGDIVPTEIDSADLLAAKRQIRTAIWKRTAADNPLTMATFLRGMNFEEGKAPHGHGNINTRLHKLDVEIFNQHTTFTAKPRWSGNKEDEKWVLNGSYEGTKEWEALREKLSVVQEERMRRLSMESEKGVEAISLDEIMNEKKFGQMFDENDRHIIKELQELGKIVAPKMAEVRFPTNAFMNDVLLEDGLYTQAGAEHFRRRLGGDIVQFHQAGGEFPKLMDNPGGIKKEEAYKALHDMERALEGPNGAVSGQDDVSNVLETYLEWTEAGGNSEQPEFIKFVAQKSILGIGIAKLLRMRNSWAQVYSGPNAPVHDMYETSDDIEEALTLGLLRRKIKGEPWTDTFEWYKKKFKTTKGWTFLRALFDAFIPLAVGVVADIGQKAGKSDKS